VKTNLLILDHDADAYRKALEEEFPEVTIHACTAEEEIGDFIEKADILLTFRISDDFLKRACALRWIQWLASGVDRALRLPSLKKEMIVTSMRGIHAPQMSEIALLLMLSLSRNFPRIVRNQDRAAWERWPAELLYGKKAGILGLGAIGQEIARKCRAFGMNVIGIGKRGADVVDALYDPGDLLIAVREIDFLVIVVPLTPQTEKMVGAEVLSSMKPSAFLINLARGDVVDEDALGEALGSGKIAGAAMDVFSREPLPQDHPFWKMKNVIITPHLGGTSTIYVDQALTIFEENLRRFLRGERETLLNLVQH
jgi:D-2-hydroxyacid dehydrogenase (NADP+)